MLGFKNQILASTVASALMLSSSAMAFDATGNEIADHFLKTMEAGGGTVESIGSVEETGDSVVISDITTTIHNNDNFENAQLLLRQITIKNGAILPNERLSSDVLTISGLKVSDDDATFSVENLVSTQIVMPSIQEVKNSSTENAIAPLYKTTDLTGILITDHEDASVPIESIHVSVDELDGDQPTAGTIILRGLVLDQNDLDDDEKEIFTDLGYGDITLNAEVKLAWAPDDGILEIEKLKVDGPDVGAVSMSAYLGGLTRDVVDQLNAAQDDPDKAMSLMQGLTVKSLNFRVDNDSVVDRILEHQAKETGTDKETFVQQISGAMPLMLTVLDNPDFQNKVAAALTAFLSNPQSLTATASPQQPVPFSQLLGTAMMAPQTLPTVLSVDIIANSAE